MKYYMCPNCHHDGLYSKSRKWVCKYCKESFTYRQFSKRDLHDKKHIESASFVSPDYDLVKKKASIVRKSKQHCESLVQQALRSIPNIWYTKLQVNAHAHTPTVGDYLVLAQDNNYVLECKELDTTKNKIFSFSRLTQIGNMNAFTNSLNKNNAYFIILLWNGNKKTSPIYVIPLKVIEAHIKLSTKKSMNITDIKKEFSNYKVPFENLELYLKKIIE